MQPLDIFKVPLTGFNLIEASAGTGKTYAIAELYLRLVLEAGCPVQRILVVTYTKAATGELKDRIRRRLAELRRAWLDRDAGGCAPWLEHCQRRQLEPELLARRLTHAVRGFDQAAIFTIHGFCQRALSDGAFAGGMAFAQELLTDERELLQQIVDDFWRREFYEAPSLLVHYLLDQGASPEALLQEIRPYLGKPYLQVLTPAPSRDAAAAEQAFSRAYAGVRALWPAVRRDIEALLVNHAGLNGNRYRKAAIPGWLDLLDGYLAPETPNLKLFQQFQKFTARYLAQSVNKGCAPPEHPLFEACEALHTAYGALAEHYRWRLVELRTRLLEYCNAELRLRKGQRQLLSYDDLLLDLQRGLGSAQGKRLVEVLRQRYSAALIDEFQDTDPVQYDIFRRIYGGTGAPVFLVGDPKQAIYSFRGADIFAYLAARRDAARHYTLDVSWRCDPALLRALNTVFTAGPQPFLFQDIPFQPAVAAANTREPLQLGDGGEPPLRFWFLGAAEDGKPLGKSQAGAQAARATAAEIARLLGLAAAGAARLGERPLAGGDIAVLVRSHRQGRLIRQQLLNLGIPSVQQVQDNVFASAEARELERLLRALAEPGREPGARAALATDLLGLSGEALYRLQQDESAWEARLAAFHEYHRLWRERGFMPMFRAVLAGEGIYRRLLGFRDGERRLTNLLHLGELLQAAAQRRVGPEGLLKWLAQQRRSPAVDDDPQQLRLESDEPLVKIVTVHKSKGLEYPIVFCPFLWDGRLWCEQAGAFSFHHPEDLQVFLDLGSPDQPANRGYARREEMAENLRLLYVALTRARYHCYVIWGAVRESATAAPAWLLHPPPAAPQPDPPRPDPLPRRGKGRAPAVAAGGTPLDPLLAAAERFEKLDEQALWNELERLARQADGAIRLTPLPLESEPVYRPPVRPEPEYAARAFAGPVRSSWRITSFSALAAGQGAAESPDYDAAARLQEPPALEELRTIHTFARGTAAGRCLHRIFETLDFTQRDRSGLERWVEQILSEHGFAADWTAVVADMVERVVATPLTEDDLRLAQVTPAERLDELEFYYPLAGLAPAGWRRLAERYALPPEPFEVIENLELNFDRGYMKGYIDLVFEAGGRFYLVDYKSNWLGPGPSAYRKERLAEVMTREAYALQYLIYTVAVHRYLRLRLPHYDYERHFGGVFYLFLRGMGPRLGPEYGIFRDRPAPRLIAALDSYLDSGTAP